MIMSRLPANRYGASSGWWAELREWLEVKFNFNYAYAFAGGLAVGVALFVLFSQTPPLDADKLSGTMIQRDGIIKSLEINGDGVAGKIEVQRSADAVRAELALVSSQPIEMTLFFDEQQLGLISLNTLEGQTLSDAILVSGAAQLTHIGQKRYAFVLMKKERASSKLEVKIVRADSLLGEWTIAVE
jgi:hypothetical protein